jgi:hypothetical protein
LNSRELGGYLRVRLLRLTLKTFNLILTPPPTFDKRAVVVAKNPLVLAALPLANQPPPTPPPTFSNSRLARPRCVRPPPPPNVLSTASPYAASDAKNPSALAWANKSGSFKSEFHPPPPTLRRMRLDVRNARRCAFEPLH